VISIALLIVGSLTFEPSALAELVSTSSVTWRGYISDNRCGTREMRYSDSRTHGLTKTECIQYCVDGGATYTFIRSGRIYTISNASDVERTLRRYLDADVIITGDVKGDSINVRDIKRLPSQSEKRSRVTQSPTTSTRQE